MIEKLDNCPFCPYCLTILDACDGMCITDEKVEFDNEIRPTPGSWTVCVYCENPLMVGERNQLLEPTEPVPEELLRMILSLHVVKRDNPGLFTQKHPKLHDRN